MLTPCLDQREKDAYEQVFQFDFHKKIINFIFIDDCLNLKKTKTKKKQLLSVNKKQEVHGPHRSPEKTVEINKHIWLYHNVD